MECYICYDKETNNNKFCDYDPCKCKGTTKIHTKCLDELKLKCGNTCGICKSKFNTVQPKEIKFEKKIEKSEDLDRELWRSEYSSTDRSYSLYKDYIETQKRIEESEKKILEYKRKTEEYKVIQQKYLNKNSDTCTIV